MTKQKKYYSVNCVVVEFANSYNNTKDIGNGKSLVVNIDVDNAEYVNRECVIKALPIDYKGELEVGMKVIVHHNIARQAHNYGGEIYNDNRIMDNLYKVQFALVYLYWKNDTWNAYGTYCFVKPIEAEKKEKIGSVYIPENAKAKFKQHFGTLVFENTNLDVKKGETVIFKKNSEHKYVVDGITMYKMDIDRVLATVE